MRHRRACTCRERDFSAPARHRFAEGPDIGLYRVARFVPMVRCMPNDGGAALSSGRRGFPRSGNVQSSLSRRMHVAFPLIRSPAFTDFAKKISIRFTYFDHLAVRFSQCFCGSFLPRRQDDDDAMVQVSGGGTHGLNTTVQHGKFSPDVGMMVRSLSGKRRGSGRTLATALSAVAAGSDGVSISSE